MLSRRFIALLALAAVAFTTMVLVSHDWHRGGSAGPATGDGVTPVQPGGEAPASAGTASPAGATPPGASTSPHGASPTDADALEAVRTLKHFCDLVTAHRPHEAAKALAGPWVWPRRELVQISRLRLVSAKVQDGRQADAVVLLARLRARLRGPSPLHDGVNTLFFTLGRDGTTGGWLITAVTSSP